MLAQEWSDAIGHYETWMRAAARSEGTIKLRRYYLERLAAVQPDPWSLAADDLAAWIGNPAWRTETRKSALSSVRSFYRWAVRSGRVQASPADVLESVRRSRRIPRPAPTAAVDRALAGATDCRRLMVLLAALGGLRCAEIAAVRPSTDVDEAGVLTVRGKGDKERRVPLHPVLAAEITAEVYRRRFGGVGTGFRYVAKATPDGWLFPGQSGGHITPSAVGRSLSRGLGDGVTGHQLRHRFATDVLEETNNVRVVQELLGHASLDTTQIYTAVSDRTLTAAVVSLKPPEALAVQLPNSTPAGCPTWCEGDLDVSGDDGEILMEHSRVLLDVAGLEVELVQQYGWDRNGEPYGPGPAYLLVGSHDLPATPENLAAFAGLSEAVALLGGQ